jgi:hypothetical protein
MLLHGYIHVRHKLIEKLVIRFNQDLTAATDAQFFLSDLTVSSPIWAFSQSHAIYARA